ncbi:MAG: hypothetical protein ACTHK5_11255 [Tsuneonella sp.]
MSRHAFAALLAVTLAVPLHAQDSAPAGTGAQQAVEQAKEAFGPPKPEKKTCTPTKPGDEIFVCAEEQEQSQFRIRSDKQAQDDYAKRTMHKGDPRAPDFEPQYPGVVVARGCFIPPCPPPKALMIDLKAIPEAPPGSDADRVGRGLAPNGSEGKAAKPTATAPTAADAPVSPPGSASPAGPR